MRRDRLALHQLREELDDDEHELRKARWSESGSASMRAGRHDVEFGDPLRARLCD